MEEPLQENELKIIPRDSINEAELLLVHTAEQGLEISEDIVTNIIHAKHNAYSDKWTEEIEKEFWQAFNNIAKVTKPVNINGLKAASKLYEPSFFKKLFKRQQKFSEAQKVVSKYRGYTFLYLILLLIFMILWTYGTTVVNTIDKLPKSIEDINKNIQQIKISKGDKAADDPELSSLEAKIEEYQNKYDASFTALQKWYKLVLYPFKRIFQIFQKGGQQDKEQTNLASTEELEETKKNQIITLQNAQFILQIMQLYLLPLLYGLVGSCAYILRLLTNEIKNLTYTPNANTGYTLRLQLGALSGLAIGWFASPETTSVIKTLSPFALAFVAGYSVELLFSLMDRIISALAGGEGK